MTASVSAKSYYQREVSSSGHVLPEGFEALLLSCDLFFSSDLPVVIWKRQLATGSRVSGSFSGTYFAREDTWSNGVDSDSTLDECGCKHAADVSCSGFAGCICELASTAALHATGDAANIDDAGGVVGSRRATLSQQRKEGH